MIRMVAGRCPSSRAVTPEGPIPEEVPDARITAADLRPALLLAFSGRPTIRSIQDEVADFYGIRGAYFRMSDRAGAREPSIAHPRQVAMFFARKFTPFSFPVIGKHFSRDHSTVMHGIKAVEKRAAADPLLEMELEVLRERFAR